MILDYFFGRALSILRISDSFSPEAALPLFQSTTCELSQLLCSQSVRKRTKKGWCIPQATGSSQNYP